MRELGGIILLYWAVLAWEKTCTAGRGWGGVKQRDLNIMARDGLQHGLTNGKLVHR